MKMKTEKEKALRIIDANYNPFRHFEIVW